MPALFHSDGRPLTDTAGNQLRTGQTITDQFLGDGIVRGTIPLDSGLGLNVLIDWLMHLVASSVSMCTYGGSSMAGSLERSQV